MYRRCSAITSSSVPRPRPYAWRTTSRLRAATSRTPRSKTPSARRCDVGAADCEIRPARQGTSGCLDTVSWKRSRVQLPAQDEWCVGRHASQRSELEHHDLHPARQHLPARLQAVDLDELQALVDRG